ncbi:cysteine rich repeat-containing protein [Ideonella sp. BN130291]|uniref:cysteine rich repeat-containing protein n=1 Tax=Ideonella sp. BN130291 TaxID=3112940 RepID=UPI002E26B5DE|nr:cysteine rich repeat-containing protein [Ideonella sp. BN130291]
MKHATGSLLLALACALGATTAFAADAPKADGTVAEACKGDVEKLCPGVQPGEGRVVACLKEHKKDVSKECKTEIVKQRKAHKAG